MEQASATRVNLLARRKQVKLAEQGAKLLRAKRDALLRELLALVKPLVENHTRLREQFEHAGRSLVLAQALDGEPFLRSVAMAVHQTLDVKIDEQRLWGVRIPQLQSTRSDDTANRLRQVSGITSRTLETGVDFDEVMEILLTLAPIHLKLTRLGAEVRTTSRRVNALEQALIPRLEQDVGRIGEALEELEREDAFRLRRIKRKLEKRDRENAS